MQKTDSSQAARMAHRQLRPSTTLNRKYVKRPTKKVSDMVDDIKPQNKGVAISVTTKTPSPKITRFGTHISQQKSMQEEKIRPAKAHPTQILVNARMRDRRQQLQQQQAAPKLTAKELKDQAIKKALQSAARQQAQKTSSSLAQQIQTKDTSTKQKKMKFGLGRIMLALSCAAAAIFAIVYFVNLNMPDLQFRAAAARLDATYPNYVPRDYTPTGISSENGTITISFNKQPSDENFIITEEKSSWDSNALYNNFVRNEYDENHTVIREQGLTIYIGDNKAAWVNGGIVYKLTVLKGSLTKKQISSIAASF